jgi:Neprosin
MSRHTQFMRHVVRLALTVGLAASVLFAGGILAAPPARASGNGAYWAQRWVAGGYETFPPSYFLWWGVQAQIKTYTPAVPASNAQSLARIAGGSYDGTRAIDVGWLVSPQLYGDSQPHFYVATRSYDPYYNHFVYCYYGIHDCSWVQVSATHKPGMKLAPESTYTFKLFYASGYWRVGLDGEVIGLIPGSYAGFGYLGRAEWYGEVDYGLDAGPTPEWTCADMGTGVFGTQSGAARMGLLFVQKWDSTWSFASPTSDATNSSFYSVSLSGPSLAGYSFGYGGPGAC